VALISSYILALKFKTSSTENLAPLAPLSNNPKPSLALSPKYPISFNLVFPAKL
jgi:hypothetical protein